MSAARSLFVVSSGRSGTHMMERLIGTRPGTEMHHEFCCTQVQPLAVKHHLGLIDFEAVCVALDRTHGAASRLSAAELFGDSSNKLSWLIDALAEVLPEARFIHLIRDGRKVVSSYYHKLAEECYDDRSTAILQAWVDAPDRHPEPPPEKKYWWNVARRDAPHDPFRGYDRFERLCAHWRDVNQAIATQLSALPRDRWLKVRLEDLLARPELVREVLEFAGLPNGGDVPALLARPHNVGTPVDHPLTRAQRGRFEAICGDAMSAHGYDGRGEYRVEYNRRIPHRSIPGARSDVGRCALCEQESPAPIWAAPDGQRGLTVHLCEHCGLVQSLPRIDRIKGRTVAVSGGADWGNVRYGKGFRTESTLKMLREAADLSSIRRCLDVGANRGSFVLRLLEEAQHARVTAVEPDENVVGEYVGDDRVDLVIGRLEETDLPEDTFDLVHCSHTLEHLKRPVEALAQLRRCMAPSSLLFVEVPNIAFIGRDDVIEEWFIDKHLYHFGLETLLATLRAAGLEPVHTRVDEVNISVVARCGQVEAPLASPTAVHAARSLARRYTRSMSASRARLSVAARRIRARSLDQKVAVWGAGRIFDRLVQVGGLDPSSLFAVVDRHLSRLVGEVHGVSLLSPEEFDAGSADLVVVASRAFYGEIRDAVRAANPDCEVWGLDQLIDMEDEHDRRRLSRSLAGAGAPGAQGSSGDDPRGRLGASGRQSLGGGASGPPLSP